MATFPNSPTLGQTADIGFKTYVWNGYAWSQASSQTPVTLSLGTTGPTGPAGATGATGADGPTGPAGATGTFTVYYSSTAPSSPSVGDIWFDSDDGVYSIYINDGDSDQWVEISGKQGATGPQGEQGIQGPTGEIPTEYVASFNGATGSVEGVSTVNGQTGDVIVSGGGIDLVWFLG